MGAKEPEGESAKPESKPAVVIDSQMTRADALGNNDFPQDFIDRMEVVDVDYLGFDGKPHRGQIVVDKDIAKEVEQIFRELKLAKFPIEKVIPIVKYKWHDQTSINDNNTSAFNYRMKLGPGVDPTERSIHSYGRAIDLNPYQNPFLDRNGKGSRPYRPSVKGTIKSGDAVTKIFAKYGWEWGGTWVAKDYQHFQKVN